MNLNDPTPFFQGRKFLLPLIPALLFLVVVLVPDIGNWLVDRDLARGKDPERAFRHLREGRNPTDALRILPFLDHEDERTRARAARDVSRLGDPRTVRPVFRAWHDGLIDDRELVNAFNRYTGAFALPILEEEFTRLPDTMQHQLADDLERLRARHERWESPPRVEAAIEAHRRFLREAGTPVWEGPLP